MPSSLRLGDIRIDRIIEGEYPFEAARTFLPDLTEEMLATNRDWLRPDALDERDWLIFCIQSYVVRTPHHTILVDSCVGNDKQRPFPGWNMRSDDTYMRALAAAGLGVEDIDFVMCTHLHADHVGWNTRLENGRWVPTFPKARYLFADREFAFWTERVKTVPSPAFADSVLPIVAANRHEFVRSDHALDDHVRLIPTPGHTPDHFAVAVGKGQDAAVITGDLIHSPIQARYPDVSMRADIDPVQSAATRRAFLERYCDTATLCCAAHFPSPSVARVKRWGEGFRCEPIEG